MNVKVTARAVWKWSNQPASSEPIEMICKDPTALTRTMGQAAYTALREAQTLVAETRLSELKVVVEIEEING